MGIGLAVAPRDGETAEEHSHPASELSASRLRVLLAARRASAAPADARSRKAPSTVPIVVVRHLPLDVKCGFDETLPGFSLLDLHLLYVQCLVDLLCPVREEGVEVLLRADGTGEDHPAVVFEDRDHVKVAFKR